jgi:hypothetical protein
MQKRPSAVYTIAALFALLCILFIPFPFHLFPLQQDITEGLFGNLIGFTAHALFGIHLKSTLVHSDAVSMYVLVLVLLVLSIGAGLLLHFRISHKQFYTRLLHVIYLLAVYYLSLMLLKYGLDKLFKHQFYLPEPNILYTPLGRLDKDILYWSSIGTSRFYNICIGSVEILSALLLIFRRTRMAGALLSIAVMAQVLMINLGFDISVKLYSSFLLFLSLFILSAYGRRLVSFFLGRNEVVPAITFPVLIHHPFWRAFIKCMLTGFMLLESFLPYIRSKNFNDDAAARPYMHGAYAVQQFISGADTLSGVQSPVKRFFIHRNGYLVFQDQQDAMQDYKLDYDTGQYNYVITDYRQHRTNLDITFNAADSLLTIHYLNKNNPITITGKGLNWRQLPALKKNFHWTVE